MGTLNWYLAYRRKSVRTRSPTRRWQETTLSSTGVNSNTLAESWETINKPIPVLRLSPGTTPARRLVPEPELCVKVKLTISSLYLSTSHTSSGSFPIREVMFHVSIASFNNRGSDHQGLGLPHNPHYTRPPRLFLWVVGPHEDLCHFFGLSPTGPHGHRPGHQAYGLLPQAQLQGRVLVTL